MYVGDPTVGKWTSARGRRVRIENLQEKLMSRNYAKLDYYYKRHHERYKKFVADAKLLCQECKGAGGFVNPVLDDGSGPEEPCGWCETTGYVTPHVRGMWLQWKREEKKLYR